MRTCCAILEEEQSSLHVYDGSVSISQFHGLLFSLPLSVPSMPQAVTADSNSSSAVFVTWMEPSVFFRKCIHYCSAVISLLCTNIYLKCMCVCSTVRSYSCYLMFQANKMTERSKVQMFSATDLGIIQN